MKKLVSLVLILILAASACGLSAFAALSYTRARSVRVSGSKTVRVGGTVQMSMSVSPRDVDYDDIEWTSSDYDIADVDSDGNVMGMAVGEATIRCRIYGPDDNNKTVRLGSGETTINVVSNLVDGKIAEASSTSSSTKSSSSAGSKSSSGGKISDSAVNEAVKKALIRGTTTKTTFKDAGSVSAAALKAAGQTMKNGGGTVLLNFDTMNGKSVEGRLSINPAAAGDLRGDIKTGVYTNDEAVSKTRTRFQKSFRNDVVIIKAAHSGSYGMNVTYAVKIGTSLAKSKNLRLYSYDPDRNKYSEISGSNIRIDNNGYVHFTTYQGDYLVISNGELTKK